MRRGRKEIIGGLILLLFLLNMSTCHTFAAEDPNRCWSNCSNIKLTSKNGCNAQAVYQYCQFYVNFWNPNANLKMKTATAAFYRSGAKVDEKSVNVEGSYASIPFYFEVAGVYTLERKVTMQDGSVASFDPVSVTLNDVTSCGATFTASPQAVSLSMTGTKNVNVMFTVSGVHPGNMRLKYEKSNDNVSCVWVDERYDTDGDGYYDSAKLSVTGLTGGSTEITVSLLQTDSQKVITTKKITVTIGPNYTISYNANGGSGAPASQTKYYGKTLALSNTKPTRTGYSFLGWATSSTATQATYASGANYTLNAATTLYAVWKPYEYTVSYNANGGSGIPASQTKLYDKTLTLSSQEPTREGYSFLGWATDSNAEIPDYQPGGFYTENKNLKLYAIWKMTPGDEVGGEIGDEAGGAIGEGAGGGETSGETGDGETSGGIGEGAGRETEGRTANETEQVQGGVTNEIVTSRPGESETKMVQKIQVTRNITKAYSKNGKFSLKATAEGKLTYKSSNKKVVKVAKNGKVTIKGYGKAKITITAAAVGDYKAASTNVTVKIVPRKLKLAVLSKKADSIAVRWNRDNTVDGYQIQYSIKNSFPKKKSMTKTGWIESNKQTTALIVQGLKKGKTYYIRICGYKGTGFNKILGKKSNVLKITFR